MKARFVDASVFVLPSYAEGLPLAILEAMAWQCAVVTTPVGNIPDVIESESNGILVAPGDVEGLAEALRRLVEDDDLRRRLSLNARRAWEEKYDSRKMAGNLAGVWARALG